MESKSLKMNLLYSKSNDEIINYFDKLLESIETEEEKERSEYNILNSGVSKKIKKEEGILWSPLQLEEFDYFDSERIRCKIIKKPDGIFHGFQVGQNVKIYRDSDSEVFGTLEYITQEKASVILNTDDIPSFIEDGNFSMEVTFSDVTYKAMKYALNFIKNSEDKIILRYKSFLFNEVPNLNFSTSNNDRNTIISKIINSKDFFVLHGPPGTGKTTLLTEVIEQLNSKGERILICASSNYAVDLLVERCLKIEKNILRLGNPIRVSENILETTLDYKVQNNSLYRDVNQYKKEATSLIKQARAFKRNFNKVAYENRKEKLKEAKDLNKLAKITEKMIEENIIEDTKIFASTLTGIFIFKFLKDLSFDSIIIDEASQALEPLTYLALILRPKTRIILTGDPKQLPPTTKDSNSVLRITLMEKLIEKLGINSSHSDFLNIQYRMNDSLLLFPNSTFYGSLLSSDSSSRYSSLDFNILNSNNKFIFIDTAGADYNEEIIENDSSIFNPGEAELLLKLFKKYYDSDIEKVYSFGILSPYRAQINFIQKLLNNFISLPAGYLEVNTIDAFQGREKDCIFLSLVRSNSNREIGFLSDERRLNVAITRARKELVIIGDSETLAKHKIYSSLIDFSQNQGGYHSIWEFLEEL